MHCLFQVLTPTTTLSHVGSGVWIMYDHINDYISANENDSGPSSTTS